ncbi:tRNA uridine-5-carboxymethylaminomethyl(34) synthesis enzyme MnmG [bacterium]|nr:tRNA uridine-5-carboxymethylaminomethyl(34) synthesis enzyme MnmG [bacterium]
MVDFDAVVIGAGHAGIEALRALNSRGLQTALVTLDAQKIGAMSCNPAIGGVAKGHLVYEIDALGGLMGFTADRAAIQAKRLNMRKGPSVRSTRVQCDKDFYSASMIQEVRSMEFVRIVEAEATELMTESVSGQVRITGVRLGDQTILKCRAALVTSGTFMKGLMFCGFEKSVGGRFGDKASNTLSDSIKFLGHRTKRLKTGTPARLDARTIEFSKLQKQWGDSERRFFSWKSSNSTLPQVCCYMTYTNERTHEIIRANMDKSPLFSGDIQGIGPRYCPSIEDKVKRFPDRERHQIFIEPEGLSTPFIYPNGMSTSLPADVQLEYLRSINGLESVELLRPGYAVEYDSIDPTQLNFGLMSQFAQGLFLAGQVNRTSGYEEAAAQGLWAGINASCFLLGEDFVRPDRSRSYIETLVDDLTTKGSEEPYRLFTSRSEYRMHLREDNADLRLLDLGKSLGLLSSEQIRAFEQKTLEVNEGRSVLRGKKIRLSVDRVITLEEYLKRPEVNWEELSIEYEPSSTRALEQIEIEAKYSGYLGRIEAEIAELQRIKDWELDTSIELDNIASLSMEVLEKYKAIRPKNVWELTQISGVTPTAVLNIAKLVGRKGGIVSHETI